MREAGTLSGSKACTQKDGGGAAAPDLECLLTRPTTTTPVARSLLSRLAAEGRLAAADVPEVEASVPDAARRLQAQPAAGPREAGTRRRDEGRGGTSRGDGGV